MMKNFNFCIKKVFNTKRVGKLWDDEKETRCKTVSDIFENL